MYSLEYLTERDLKYFEKKEARGEAIIIRIEPETLLSLDLDRLFQEKDKDQTLSAEELEDFFHRRRDVEMPVLVDKNTNPENLPITGIEKNLQYISLPEDERQNLLQLINAGITDDELMEIFKDQVK